MMDEQVTNTLHQIVGAARARSIDTEQRVRNYRANILGGRTEDQQQIDRLLERLTDQQKDHLWQMLKKDILTESNWRIYEIRFLMKAFDVQQLTIEALKEHGPPSIPTLDDDTQVFDVGDVNV